MVKFLKFCSESFYRFTDRCCCVQSSYNIFRREIGETVRYLPDKKNKISAASQAVATARIATKIFHTNPPTFGSQFSKFHPNRFTFGGVIAESRGKREGCSVGP